jgi:galactokinase
MVQRRFEEIFGSPPRVLAEAPGRVNLIGEHTDYNGGFVMPVAIPQRAYVALTPRHDSVARVFSVQLGEAEYRIGHEARSGRWIDYVQGVTRALADVGALTGFDALVHPEVPIGSGLASSAALEVAFGRALREAFSLSVGDEELARAGQRAEHELVGAPVGIMDQMAASLADETTVLFLDTRSLEFERIPLPVDAALVVIHSGITHRHSENDYAVRRAECQRAASLLNAAELRDVSVDDLARVEALPAPLNRRAQHVVTENARVLAARTAIRGGDLAALGALLNASHGSLRDDYEVSVAEIDTMVAIATATPGVYGARISGGGFGGSVVILTRSEVARTAANAIATEYARRTSQRPLVVVPDGGIREAAATPRG